MEEEIFEDKIVKLPLNEEINLTNTLYKPTIVGGSLVNSDTVQGAGNNVIKSSPDYGLWIGSPNFNTAPFRVSMDGSVVGTSATFTDYFSKSGDTSDDITEGSTNKFLLPYSVESDHILSAAITEIKIAEDAVTQAKIAASAVGSDQIEASAVIAGKLAANSVVSDAIAAGSVVASKITVDNLAAIKAHMGNITAGTLTMDAAGYIKGGQTAYNTGTGFFLGYDTDAYKLSIGVPTGDSITWDGSSLDINGDLQVNYLAGDYTETSSDSESSEISDTEYNVVKQIRIFRPGTLRISFDLITSNDGYDAYAKITNQSGPTPTGTEQTWDDKDNWETFSEDLSGWSRGDLVTLSIHSQTSGTWAKARNFRLKVLNPTLPQVIT